MPLKCLALFVQFEHTSEGTHRLLYNHPMHDFDTGPEGPELEGYDFDYSQFRVIVRAGEFALSHFNFHSYF